MVQPTNVSEIALLRTQTTRAIEMGDLSTAYCTSKRILNIMENTHPRSEDLPSHLYELGLICIALDNFPEGARHLQRAIESCEKRGRIEDAWLLKEAMFVLKDIQPEYSEGKYYSQNQNARQ